MKWKKHQIVMISREYPNGRKSRLVGFIVNIDKRDFGEKGVYVTLSPLPRSLAKPIREKYCTEEYNYQGAVNTYSDQYGFSCNHVHRDTTVILGEIDPPKRQHTWYPQPGDTAYDLMC